jgi:hypothetical protein
MTDGLDTRNDEKTSRRWSKMEKELRKNGSLVAFAVLMIVAVLMAFIVGFGNVNVAHADDTKQTSPAPSGSPAASAAPEASPTAADTVPIIIRTAKPSGSPAAKPSPIKKNLNNSYQLQIDTTERLEKERQARIDAERERFKRKRKRSAGPTTNIGHPEVNGERARYPQSGGFTPGSLIDLIQKAVAKAIGPLAKEVKGVRTDVNVLKDKVEKLETAATPAPAPPTTPSPAKPPAPGSTGTPAAPPTPGAGASPASGPSPAPGVAPSGAPGNKPQPVAPGDPAAAPPVAPPPPGEPPVTLKWPWEGWTWPTPIPAPAPSTDAKAGVEANPPTPAGSWSWIWEWNKLPNPPQAVTTPPAEKDDGDNKGDKEKPTGNSETPKTSGMPAWQAMLLIGCMFLFVAGLIKFGKN